MNEKLNFFAILFLFPFYPEVGFTEGENGYDLKKFKSLLNRGFFIIPREKVLLSQIFIK